MNLQPENVHEYLASQNAQSLLWIVFCITTTTYLLYSIGHAIYCLTLHPLARFPGPFLCRFSFLQQCYYEAFLNGKFVEMIPEYHRVYGKAPSLLVTCLRL